MRTTLDLNDALLIEAKQQAARSNQTLTAFVEAALRRLLREGDRPAGAKPPKLPVFGSGGGNPEVNFASGKAMLEFMEKHDGKYGR